MFQTSPDTFAKRSKSILRNRKRITGSSQLHVGPDGLLTVRPRRMSAVGRLPIRGLLIVGLTVIVAKALMLVQAGSVGYDERIQRLATGSTVERASAWVMQADPVTVALADRIRPLLK